MLLLPGQSIPHTVLLFVRLTCLEQHLIFHFLIVNIYTTDRQKILCLK